MKKGLAVKDDYSEFFKDFRWREDREEELKPLINRPMPTVEETIDAILDAGGIPVLAHPLEQLDYIPELVKLGLKGVEINHPILTKEEMAVLPDIADKYNLYKSAGTDHSGVLGGFTELGDDFIIADDVGVINEEHFMEIYNRVKFC